MTHLPITISRNSTASDRQTALCQIYLQILERQPYAYERQELAQLEKDFLRDRVGVKRFVKELGKSAIYLNNFYHSTSNMKFLELCFKHFLGRAPANRDEVQIYGNILMHKGVAALISAIVDSEEYRKAFGGFTVPHPRTDGHYESPKAYLESQMLNHEHLGRRGRSLPTLYWRDLGLECEAGVCQAISNVQGKPPRPSVYTETALSDDEEFSRVLDLLELAKSKRSKGLPSTHPRAQRRAVSPTA